MIEPYEDGEDDCEVSSTSVVVEVIEQDNKFRYEFHLLLPAERESVDLNELRALKMGLEEATSRLEMIISRFDDG